MTARRIVVETDCPECGRFHTESLLKLGGDPESSIAYCYTGGSRRVLTPGSYVLIEKVDGGWPEETKRRIVNEMYNRRATWHDTVDRLLTDLSDALAGAS